MTIAFNITNTPAPMIGQDNQLASSFQSGQGLNFLSLILSRQPAQLESGFLANTLSTNQSKQGNQENLDALALTFQPFLQEDQLVDFASLTQEELAALAIANPALFSFDSAAPVKALELIDGKLVLNVNKATELTKNSLISPSSILLNKEGSTPQTPDSLGLNINILKDELGQFILAPENSILQTASLTEMQNGFTDEQSMTNILVAGGTPNEWRLSRLIQSNPGFEAGATKSLVSHFLANHNNNAAFIASDGALQNQSRSGLLALPFESVIAMENSGLMGEGFEELIIKGHESSLIQQPTAKTVSSHFTSHIALSKGPAYIHPALEQVSLQIARGAQRLPDVITLQLDPAELGKVRIEMEIAKDGKVRTLISAESPQTLDLLRNDSRTLNKALNDAGLETGENSLEFNLSQGESFAEQNHRNFSKNKNPSNFLEGNTEEQADLDTTLLVSATGIITPNQINILV